MKGNEIEGILDRIQKKLSILSIPLFLVGSDRRGEVVATGFFLNVDENIYLVTASHVFDGLIGREDMGICFGLTGNKIANFPYGSSVIRTDSGTTGSGSLDIAVIPILESADFYNEIQPTIIGLETTAIYQSTTCVDVQIVQGFPISKNKFAKNADLKNKILEAKAHGFSFQFAKSCDFTKHEKDENTHYAIDWPHKLKGNKTISPRGCSGAGYWFIPNRYDLGTIILAGVFIEYHKNDGIGYVTKIEEVVSFIRNEVAPDCVV